ncbi:MAG: hypothetical protein QOF37_2271 [Thermoleophilaceae bacterium]|nr:hypothetical protein [Thermoleophilaceae bacterium]
MCARGCRGLALAVIAWCLLGAGQASANGPELISNGGFETAMPSQSGGTVGPANGNWLEYSQGSAQVGQQQAGGPLHSGDHSGEVSTQTGSQSAGYFAQDLSALDNSCGYQLTGWVNPQAGEQELSLVWGWDRNSASSGALASASLKIFSDHTEYSAFGNTASSGALTQSAWHQVTVNADGPSGTSSLAIDGQQVAQTSNDPAFPNAPPALLLGQTNSTNSDVSHFYYDDLSLTATRGSCASSPGAGNISNQDISQVVFVHGVRGSCELMGNQPGGRAYSPVYSQLYTHMLGVFSFCYDHDLAFSDNPSETPGQCFASTSLGPSAVTALTSPTDTQTGPLFASQDKPGIGQLPYKPYDSNGPLAYDATHLDDCLAALVNYDVQTYGHPLPIAVLANSMGGAITRGWLALANARGSSSLQGVTTVIFLQGATEGSWLARVGETSDAALSSPFSGLGSAFVDEFVRRTADLLCGISTSRPLYGCFDPARAGIQDLVPAPNPWSNWYASIAAAGPPPQLHYYSFSTDITINIDEHFLFWTISQSTNAFGDGLMQLGPPGSGPLHDWGSSEFLPFGPGPDANQYVMAQSPTFDVDANPLDVALLAYAIPDYYFGVDNYSHFRFGDNTATNMVSSCYGPAGTVTVVQELDRLTLNPGDACAATAPGEHGPGGPRKASPAAQESSVPSPSSAKVSTRELQPVRFPDRSGHTSVAVYTARDQFQGRVIVSLGHGRSYNGNLPSGLVKGRTIRLHRVVAMVPATKKATKTIRVRLDGTLSPASHRGRLTIHVLPHGPRVHLTTPTLNVRGARTATNRAEHLLAGNGLLALARMASPTLLGGRSATAFEHLLRAQHVKVTGVANAAAGHGTSLPDGEPGWIQPVVVRAKGHRPLHVKLVLEQVGRRWFLAGSSR